MGNTKLETLKQEGAEAGRRPHVFFEWRMMFRDLFVLPYVHEVHEMRCGYADQFEYGSYSSGILYIPLGVHLVHRNC